MTDPNPGAADLHQDETDTAEQENFAGDLSTMGAAIPPKSFIEGRGAWMMTLALGTIGLLCLGTFALWFFTLPTVADVESLCKGSSNNASLDATKHVEMFTSLRKVHTDGFKDMFQLVVLSGLIPIFTLLAGYVFGTRQSATS